MKNGIRDKKSLGDRMKEYEFASKTVLTRRSPIIIRLDGKAFHTFTRNFKKPFDDHLMNLMDQTAKYVCENIQGAQIAYVQSDEISIFTHGYKTLDSEPWFANEVQKMVSISAALASSYFSMSLYDLYDKLRHRGYDDFVKPVQFDSRVFVIPCDDIDNYFIWRQQDWERNSIQMFGLSYFSQKELHRVNCKKIVEKCEVEKGTKWTDLPTHYKRGRCIYKADEEQSNEKGESFSLGASWFIDKNVPIFKEDRDFITKYLKVHDE